MLWSVIITIAIYVFLIKEPVWQEIGTHIGTLGRQVTPTNISDGFFYVLLLQSLEALLNNSSILLQVAIE